MDMSPFLDSLSALDNPLLPTPIGVQVALRLSWALVLGSLSWLLAGRLAYVYRLSLLVLVAVWTCLPGSLSPAYWLGLAFQTPSLMSSVLCGAWLFVGVVRRRTTANATAAWAGDSLSLLCLAGIVGGWVLLLDTLAWWPVSIYALGFSPAALGGVALRPVIISHRITPKL